MKATIALRSGSKQPDQDLVEEVITVRLETNSDIIPKADPTAGNIVLLEEKWDSSKTTVTAPHNIFKELNDFRPVALTSLMKCFEQLVKKFLMNEVQDLLDPMQFAYWPNRGVDATTTLFNFLYKHLETFICRLLLSF